MEFREHIFKGEQSKYPRPECLWDEANGLLIVTLAWGDQSIHKKVQTSIADYYLTSQKDKEATSPFPKLSSISSLQNSLRTSIFIANELIYREYNKEEYTSGCEVLVFAKSKNEIAIASFGSLKLILQKENHKPSTIYNIPDLSFEISNDKALAPLPGNLLGVSNDINPSTLSFPLNDRKDKYFFLYSTDYEGYFFNKKSIKSVDNFVDELKKEQKEKAFWIACLST